MSDEQDRADPANPMGLEDLSQIFAPSWARQTPDELVQKAARFARDDDDRGDRRSSRPPRRDAGSRPPRRDGDSRPPRRDGRPPRRDEARRNAPPPPLDIDVRFMPAGKALAAIIRRIQATHRAYPIRDVVKLFQNDDAGLAVRIEARKGGSGPDQIFQCRACGMPALSEAEVAEHLLKKHFADFFDVEEVEAEAPVGNFPCVARCGLTGELLGPPNHHGYAHRIQEMLADRFPGMAEEEYRRHVEMVRDPEVIEQWREQCKRKRVFRRKQDPAQMAKDAAKEERKSASATADEPPADSAPEEAAPAAPALGRHEAEMLFRRDIMPGLIGAASHVVCPATSLKDLPDRRLASELNARFADETDPGRRFLNRRPPQPAEANATLPSRLQRNGSLFAAVHAAFHHRGLHFFRAVDERGQEFVMASQPVPLDLDHATPELREIAQYVADHPSCPPKQLIEALNPANDGETTQRLASQVKWLVEKGHLIEFFNGFLSPPAPHPIFKPNPPKPKRAASEGDRDEAQPSQEAEGDRDEAQPSQEAGSGSDEAQPSQEAIAEPEAPTMTKEIPNA